MKLVIVCALGLAILPGCNKSEDSNQDSNGACKQEYLDAWNAVGLAKIYSTSAEKSSACLTLKNKGSVSCKASVTTSGVGGSTSDRNISYADHKEYCEPTSSTTPDTPATDSYNGYNGGYNSTPSAPRSKYSSSSGGACNQEFLDLYNGLNKNSKLLVIAQQYNVSDKVVSISNDLLSQCSEKRIAEVQTASCYASKPDSYSYYGSTSERVSLVEFDSACKLAEQTVAAVKEIELARSVRVLSKVEDLEGNIDNMIELKKFNSVGGATYLVDGKWLKQDQMKAKLVTLADNQTLCNVTTTALDVTKTMPFKADDVKVSKDSVRIAATNQSPELSTELHKVEMNLVTVKSPGLSIKVRCFKRTEITIDDVQVALKNTLKLDAVKTKN
jgi:hypothetical protein